MWLFVEWIQWLQLTLVFPYPEYLFYRTLLYLEQFIRSLGHLALDHLALDQSKKLSISRNLDISNFCLCWTNFPVLWAVFSRYLELFPKFPKLFAISFLKLIFFQPSLPQLLQLCRQKWVQDSQIDFFVHFLIKCFNSIFLSLEYSIKVLFKDDFTENHGVFETRTYQRNRC